MGLSTRIMFGNLFFRTKFIKLFSKVNSILEMWKLKTFLKAVLCFQFIFLRKTFWQYCNKMPPSLIWIHFWLRNYLVIRQFLRYLSLWSSVLELRSQIHQRNQKKRKKWINFGLSLSLLTDRVKLVLWILLRYVGIMKQHAYNNFFL